MSLPSLTDRPLNVVLLAFRRRLSRPERRGQSLVEFALLLPLLLVILLGVADFGRVFHAGIVMESATRAAAEAAALEYLRAVDDKDAAYVLPPETYNHIREVAIAVACREARLPNADPDADCAVGPAIRVCIHDAAAGDPCTAPSTAPVPAQCTEVSATMNSASALPVQPTDANPSPRGAYVEVRTCYHFTTLFNLDISLPLGAGLGLGDVYLQKEAVFTVADY
jgi:Flp pilus assembly protein TadG